MRIRELIPWRSRARNRLSVPVRKPANSFETGMRRIFDELFEVSDLAPSGKSFGWTAGDMLLKVDVAETDDAVQVTADLPGLSDQDVEVTLADGELVISGEKKAEKEDKQKNYHRVERTYGSFHRSIPLPAKVDGTKVDASFHNGVLKVVLPKTADSGTGKKIPVCRLA